MQELIKALQIFSKYTDLKWPTHCENSVFCIMGITKDEVSEDDQNQLKELRFFWNESEQSWASYRYSKKVVIDVPNTFASRP